MGGKSMGKILVVDDDPAVRIAISWALRETGHEVMMAGNGKEAIELLKTGELPDLVITDILMPKMDGLELISALQARWPQMEVIAISGGGFFCGSDLFLGLSQKCGAARILEKPISSPELQAAVREVLDKPLALSA